ncbi:MAG TPA: ATP-grasp domain-containing protein [Myxococcales bacterium]|nr:ATP-grasp domain-containing protein [Myxococcales bacterium]
MRIAFSHNPQLSASEEEAEFDTPTTVKALAEGLERLGHRVEKIEVSGPASRTVSRLEAYNPDLVFNTAEGRRGRFREAFYPALFEELGFAYTGGDPYTLALTLDKQLTKMVVAQHGVRTPGWKFVEDPSELKGHSLRLPVIVKPNFEGSSKGITQDSVVEDGNRLERVVAAQLAKYPAGVLVEEFIVGRDLTVPYLEAVAGERGGVLAPVEYVVDPKFRGRHAIYDFELKTRHSDAVTVQAPAQIPAAIAEELARAARTVFKVTGCRDLGRIDFRLGDDGLLYFLEVNALPSLEPGAGIYAAAALEGLHFDAVLEAVISSAAARWKVKDSREPRARPARRSGPLRVGFTFNVKRVVPVAEGGDDTEAEYDSPKTLQAIREAISSYGHEVIDLEATSELPQRLATTPIDLVFNIAEGFKGRNREAQVPATLELLDIPYTGSDPAALSIALDKALAKKMVRQHGILTPDFVLMQSGKERLPKEMRFPVIVKPVAEGSSKGVFGKSVVDNEPELRELARELAARYRQPALVESYIGGREFTVGMLGERRPKVLPIMEVVFTGNDPTPVYDFQSKLDWNQRVRYDAPAKLEPAQQREIERAARGVFAALGCRDVARVDFRMDAEGRVYFLECNPLPGLTPGWSDLVMIAQAGGLDYRGLIGEILACGIRRYQERERERRREERSAAVG